MGWCPKPACTRQIYRRPCGDDAGGCWQSVSSLLEHLWVDQGYTGPARAWIEEHLGWSVEVVKHPPKVQGEWQPRGDLDDLSTVWFEWVRIPPEPKRFRGPLPRRWVAERTIGWLSLSRRMSKDYESGCARVARPWSMQ